MAPVGGAAANGGAGLLDWARDLHGKLVADRRRLALATLLAELVPRDARLLDVGCGDGSIAALLAEQRPDLEIRGLDVFVRPEARIPVERYDGVELPYEADSFDAVVYVDVLHHTPDPAAQLREAMRVSRRHLVIKDHTLSGILAHSRLRLMDRVGNPPRGFDFPDNYWPERRWRETFEALGLGVEVWRSSLGLYPAPADWIFGRGLHFVARLGKR